MSNFWTLGAILICLSSCLKFNEENSKVSSQEVADILANNCITCHKEYASYSDSDFVNNGLIVPKKPKSSFLYTVLKGVNLGTNESMPPQGELSKEDLEDIRLWINKVKVRSERYLSQPKFIKDLKKRELSPTKLLSRCYSQLVRKPLPLDHKLLARVKNKEITGEEACHNLIDGLEVDEKGMAVSEEGREILKNLNSLHLSWFSEINFYNDDEQFGNFELYDPGHLAAYYTYSFLDTKSNFSDIFLKEDSYELVRKPYEKEREFFVFPNQIVSDKPLRVKEYKFGSGYEISDDFYPAWDIPHVATGELIGLKKMEPRKYVIPKVVNRRKGLKEAFGQNEYHVNADIYKSLGGGIIGNPLFLILNMKTSPGEPSDGGVHVPRKWGVALFKDFLCRDLPVAPMNLTKKYVQEKSWHSFRKKESCVQCHMSMDGVSGVIRNLELTYSVDQGLGKYIQTSHIYGHKPQKKESTDLLGNGLKDFHLEPTLGNFVFKSFNGTVYDRPVSSLDDLGETLVETPDLYRCVVSRYLYFLTGVSVDLNHPLVGGDYEAYINHILRDLSNRLQNHQNLRQTMKDIMATELYKDRYFLDQDKVSARGIF